MWRVTWRNLVARKLRLALSGFAIVLGVAFVAGSFIFTDAMGSAFDGIIKGSTADVEIAPTGANDFDSSQDSRTIPAAVVAELEELPEAESVHPYNQLLTLYVIGKDGELVGGNGPPGLGLSDGTTRSITGNPIVEYVEGERPVGPDEITLDVDTAENGGYKIGDTVTLVSPGDPPKLTAELVGLIEFGHDGALAGATLTLFEAKAMQDLFFDGRDAYSGISLNTADGVSQTELRDAAAPLLSEGVTARTGEAVVEKGQEGLQEILGFLNTFLLVFAAVAMVVGTFLIINTFSILVAQRSRELALLRAMGASRRQVNRSVLTEAFAVSLVGSTLGIGVGYLLAIGLRALFGLIGLDLSGAEFPIALRTVLVSYAVGVIVTMIAAYLPARRAARIPPVAAMRDDVALPEASIRRRLLVGAGMIAIGIGLMIAGFAGDGSSGLSMIGLGMLSILIGVSLMSPVLGRPVVYGLGAAYRRIFGTVGTLASQNALRNPRRTAATASALMIGLTLVALMSILGRSATASTDKAVESTLTSQFIVSNAVGTPFSPAVAEQIREVDGIETVAQFRQAFPQIDGSTGFVGAADPQELVDALNIPMVAGALAALEPGTTLVDTQTAEGEGYEIGDTIKMEFQGGTLPLEVAGVFGNSGAIPADYLITLDTLEEGGLAPLDSLLFISKEESASTADIRTAVDEITKDLPTVTLKDPGEFAAEQKEQITFFLNVIYALLGLAVVIAVLGIINTLALSVIERTREIGLLRAVGLSRRQLRRMVRLESVVVAVLGAVLGVVMGIVFGVALQRAIADEGIDVLSIPWLQLAVFVVLAAIVGILAAVLPARRAAKLDVLRAISTE
ncbi:MAG TPA: FtsX-like permease family protein [Nocardioidaceae bacterium]|nr:FtsX-like permease family protein [Nocardioidaceae bacterium]